LALSLLTGCGGGGPVTLTVVSPFDESDGNRINFVNAYRAYETATGNTVSDVAEKSSEAWKTGVMTDFRSGDEPDVLFYFIGADAKELVDGGKVVPISDIRKKYPDYASNMKDSMIPVANDGRQYAVPVNGYWEGLFVNKKVLEDCGVELPDADYTWEQFLTDCQIIKDKGYTPIACSLLDVPHYWFEFCTLNGGGQTGHLTLPKTTGDAAGTAWSKGLSDIKELYEKGFFPANTLTAKDEDINGLMTADQAAFMLDGSWKVGWFQEQAKDENVSIEDFAVTYVPAPEDGGRKPTEIIGGLSMGYYITKKAWNNSKKQKACVEFVRAMTTDAVVSAFGALSVTALKNGTTPPENADALVTSALEMTKGCTGIVAAVQDSLSTPARNQLFEDIRAVVIGELSPEAAINKCFGLG
jgi:raffinose/stachyose/melibiose transport system substrate-binding protein